MISMKKTSTLFLLLSFLTIGCAHDSNVKTSATSQGTKMSGGGEYVVLDFEKGRSDLSQMDRDKLNRLNRVTDNEGRKIEEINVLAWADREYPGEGTSATRADVSLASDRADQIKKFFKDELRTTADVENLNMAERPGYFGEVMKTDSYRTKTEFERSGAAPTQSKLIGNKASKAVVFIKYE